MVTLPDVDTGVGALNVHPCIPGVLGGTSGEQYDAAVPDNHCDLSIFRQGKTPVPETHSGKTQSQNIPRPLSGFFSASLAFPYLCFLGSGTQ